VTEFLLGVDRSEAEHLQFIKQLSNQAPQLEYLAFVNYMDIYCGKRVGGEWVHCDEAEFVDF
jgi:hypothetical protein